MVHGKVRLMKTVSEKNNIMLYYVTIEELLDIIYTTHSSIEHGVRNRMILYNRFEKTTLSITSLVKINSLQYDLLNILILNIA